MNLYFRRDDICTVDWEIFTVKILFCRLLRQRQLNVQKIFYDLATWPCGEN